MSWVVIVIGVIVVIAIISAVDRSSAAADRAKIADEKSLAYADYLKRTSANPKLREMTNNELREFVSGKIRSYNKEISDIENGGAVLIGIFVTGSILFAVVIQELFPLFLGVLGGLAAYRFQNSSRAGVDAKYKKEGLDPARLKVEKTS